MNGDPYAQAVAAAHRRFDDRFEAAAVTEAAMRAFLTLRRRPGAPAPTPQQVVLLAGAYLRQGRSPDGPLVAPTRSIPGRRGAGRTGRHRGARTA